MSTAVTIATWTAAVTILFLEFLAGWRSRLALERLWVQAALGNAHRFRDHCVDAPASLTASRQRVGGMLRPSRSRRSGSRRTSIWTIFPFVTVKAITENTRRCGATTAPAAPLTSAGLTNG